MACVAKITDSPADVTYYAYVGQRSAYQQLLASFRSRARRRISSSILQSKPVSLGPVYSSLCIRACCIRASVFKPV